MTGAQLVALLVVLAGYVLSLYLHPYRRCRACGGSGVHRGGIFAYSSRPCHGCGGRGVHQRLGAAVLGIGYRSQRTSRFQRR